MITSFEMEWICVGKGKWSKWKTMELWTFYTLINIDIYNHGLKSLFVCANSIYSSNVKMRNWNLSNFSCSSFPCDASKSTNPHVKHDCGSKFVHVKSTMTTFIKLQTPSLEKTMLARHQNELNVVEKNTCNCSHLTWKLISQKVDEEMSWITSFVLCLLSWTHHKK